MGWWGRASTEQKLAQLDGAIELGPTSPQIALAVGAGAKAIRQFAWFHGRKLGRVGVNKFRKQATARDLARTRRVFLRGDRVSFFDAPPSADEFRLDDVEV